jgi:hypothetical protein
VRILANRTKGHLATQIGSRGMAMRIIGVDHGSKESLVKECGAEVFLDITKFDDKTLAQEVKKVTGGRDCFSHEIRNSIDIFQVLVHPQLSSVLHRIRLMPRPLTS